MLELLQSDEVCIRLNVRCSKSQMIGDTCPRICKDLAPSDRTAQCACQHADDRDMFARVIRAWPCGIIAVISADEQEIAIAQKRQYLGHASVEFFKARCITRDVPAMSEIRVEIDEIGEQQTAVRQLLQGRQHAIKQIHVIGALDLLASITMIENIANLADAYDVAFRFGRTIKNIAIGWRDRKVLAVWGPFEISSMRSHKWPRDDSANMQGVNNRANAPA